MISVNASLNHKGMIDYQFILEGGGGWIVIDFEGGGIVPQPFVSYVNVGLLTTLGIGDEEDVIFSHVELEDILQKPHWSPKWHHDVWLGPARHVADLPDWLAQVLHLGVSLNDGDFKNIGYSAFISGSQLKKKTLQKLVSKFQLGVAPGLNHRFLHCSIEFGDLNGQWS